MTLLGKRRRTPALESVLPLLSRAGRAPDRLGGGGPPRRAAVLGSLRLKGVPRVCTFGSSVSCEIRFFRVDTRVALKSLKQARLRGAGAMGPKEPMWRCTPRGLSGGIPWRGAGADLWALQSPGGRHFAVGRGDAAAWDSTGERLLGWRRAGYEQG